MRSNLFNIAVDCANAYELAQFWSKVVGHPLNDDDFPGESTAVVRLPTGVRLYFAETPEAKARAADASGAARAPKNPLHLCFQPDGPRDAEVDRLKAVGATVLADLRTPDGKGWVVFQDPERNEFCVLRSEAERLAGEEPDAPGEADTCGGAEVLPGEKPLSGGPGM
ncbi:VOC family protein [Streptomyces kanamyceticus]|uniref:VOC family protein n=1 Tax=Streptomyces kanamyceticus TaxID=1967 RepID=UPI0007C82BB3|nr:VOC family protein [Streptomyces kanamyceticus]